MQLPVSPNRVALVDDDVYEWACQHPWSLAGGRSDETRYVARAAVVNGRRRTLYLHRLVMDAPARIRVDHRNGDHMDNRRENLRLVTNSQNMQNRRGPVRATSGVRGVYLMTDKRRRRYRAAIEVNYRQITLGYYATLEEAAEAVSEGRRRLMTHAPEN